MVILMAALPVFAQENPEEADRLYRKGRSLAYDRKYKEALDTLRLAFEQDPNNQRVVMTLGDVYMKMGNFAGAEQAFNQLRNLDPHKPQGYVKLAELYWLWKRPRQALEFVRTAEKLSDPADADVYKWMGQIYRSLQMVEKSDSIIDQGLKFYPSNPALLAGKGTNLVFLEDTARAREYIDSAYKMDSSSVYVVNTLVSFKLLTGDIPEASRYLERATRLDPDHPYTRSSIAAYSMAYRGSKVQALFSDANEAYARGLYRKARDIYHLALKEDSLFFEVYVNLGFTYIHLGEPELAAQSFEKAAELNPQYAPAYVGWGDALVGQGEIEEAVQKYEKALELAPENPEIKQIYEEAKQALEAGE